MSVVDFFHHIFHPSAQAPGAAPASAQAAPSKDPNFSFDDLLDVVNPLQHLPVVGTLYRAITGDRIKTPEKIAGDTLYGGVWGMVSSVADTAFQAITGKNVGDTVLAFLTGGDDSKPAAVASAPLELRTSTALAQPAATDVTALTASLTRTGAESETAQRAVYAYRRAYTLTGGPALAPF